MADTSDRVIPATPRRRELARRQGMMPTSGLAAWAAAAAVAVALLPAWLALTLPAAEELLRQSIDAASRVASVAPASAGGVPVAVVLPTVAVILAAAAAGLGVRFLLDGFSWQPARALPTLRRIDVLAGMARIFSGRTLAGIVGAAIGLAVLLAAAWLAIGPLLTTAATGSAAEAATIGAAAWRAAAWLIGAGATVAAGQWLVARRRFERMIRMTPEEFAEEAKSMQADPKIRLLQQQRRRQAAGGS